MPKNQTYMIAGLVGVAGAVGAFFVVRSFMRWRQQQMHDQAYQERARRRLEGRTIENMEGVPVEGTRYQPIDQPDRQPIPATGPSTPEVKDVTVVEMTNQMIDSQEQAPLESQVDALVQYLFAFHDMIEQLRARRIEFDNDAPDARSLTETDRSMIQDTIDRLEERLADYDEGSVEGNSLKARVYRLTVKLRDALQNFNYTDDDLFRLNGEVSAGVCQLLDEIQETAVHTNENFHRIRWTYDCDTSLNG